MEIKRTEKKAKESGAGLVEYCLVVALVATVGMASIEQVGTALDEKFTKASMKVCEAGAADNLEACQDDE